MVTSSIRNRYESGEVSELGLNLEQIGSVPLLFALIMAAMAAAVLAHVLAVATHARRRDLAVLRVLGFRRGQLLRTVVWQSTVYAATAVAIGVPAGVALGRLAWHAYGTNLGVVPEVVTPWSELLAVAVTALVLAVAVAVVATAGIARATPASVLRTE
jgi:ABC-type antimicrobial peptide transport system permease subunit